jgi:hypothetical protein
MVSPVPGSPEPIPPPGRLVDMPMDPLAAAGPEPGSEEILPEYGWDWPDPDCSRPPELAGLTYEELDALPATTPARYREPAWPIDPPRPRSSGQLTRSPVPAGRPNEKDRCPQDSSGTPDAWPRDGLLAA